MSGEELYELVARLYPICRSITGDGVRQTLKIIGEHIPLKIREVRSGTKVFDWVVPKEWNIRAAHIKDSQGKMVLNFRSSNLHVLNYSIPVSRIVTFEELKEHIFTIPEYPDLIPYRTSYYSGNWGFCMSHNQFTNLDKNQNYEVFIDSTLEEGYLTYGELYIKGQTDEEILISTHICHPSLCNDNLSGIAVATFLAKELINREDLRYSYRFIFIPATIGAITWLTVNEVNVENILGGFVITLLGDNSNFTLKKTRIGDSLIDMAAMKALNISGHQFELRDFSPYGYDERQFSSPGFNIPMACLTRKPFGEFKEYHTSADNLSFVHGDKLHESLDLMLLIVQIIEQDHKYLNLNPKCEPQLGKYGLYSKFGGSNESKQNQLACLWILNMSDGEHSLLDISNKSKISFNVIAKMAQELVKVNLIAKI
jgi:aminopeptidase-like protein